MKKRFFAVVVTASLLLGGCGASNSESDASAAGLPTTAATTPEATQTSEAVELPDPHTMTGLTEAASLPDPQPLDDDYPQKLPAAVTDAEGRSVTVTDTYRVLALDLYGTLSRTVISLGYGENLVGRTVSSTEEQLADLPVVTENGHSLNAEAVLSLNPTLIIADRSIGPTEAIEQLRSAGIPVVIVDSERSIDTNTELIEQIANSLGVPEAGAALAERTEQETQAALDQIAQWTPEVPLAAAFLYVRGTASVFFILGADEGADALITSLGATDVATANRITTTTPANAESLVALNPEVILTMTEGLASADGLDAFLARPGVSQTRAGQNSRVVAIPDGIALSFGPQTGDILLSIARAIYGVEDPR